MNLSPAAARRIVERETRFRMTDVEWRDVLASADINPALAMDEADVHELAEITRRLPRFCQELRESASLARELIGTGPKPVDNHVRMLLAFTQLEAIKSGVDPHRELKLDKTKLNASIGRMIRSLVAAQYLADRHALPLRRTLFELLRSENDLSDEADSPFDDTFGLAQLAANAVAFGYQTAFGPDLRSASSSTDLRLVLAVLQIVRRERRSVRSLPSGQRWAARYGVYRAEHQRTVGREFDQSKDPAAAFKKAFKDAQRRVLRISPDWKVIASIE